MSTSLRYLLKRLLLLLVTMLLVSVLTFLAFACGFTLATACSAAQTFTGMGAAGCRLKIAQINHYEPLFTVA